MPLIKCKHCGEMISDKAVKCPKCGAHLEDNNSINKDKKHKKSGISIGLTIVLCGICLIAGATIGFLAAPGGKAKIVSQNNGESDQIIQSYNSDDIETMKQDKTNKKSADTNESNLVASDATLGFAYCPTDLFENILEKGSYKCGNEIKPGKYIMLGIKGCSNTMVRTDPNTTDGAMFYSSVFECIDLEEGQYIDIVDWGALVPFDELDQNDLTKYGIFTVGKDIDAGEYKAKSGSHGADGFHGFSGYSILNSLDSTEDAVKVLLTPDDQKYLTLSDGQYIVLSGVNLYKS